MSLLEPAGGLSIVPGRPSTDHEGDPVFPHRDAVAGTSRPFKPTGSLRVVLLSPIALGEDEPIHAHRDRIAGPRGGFMEIGGTRPVHGSAFAPVEHLGQPPLAQ